jgi:hypothetical protein
MITERILRQWRRDALRKSQPGATIDAVRTPEGINIDILYIVELNSRILRLTQELLDQHLLRKA